MMGLTLHPLSIECLLNRVAAPQGGLGRLWQSDQIMARLRHGQQTEVASRRTVERMTCRLSVLTRADRDQLAVAQRRRTRCSRAAAVGAAAGPGAARGGVGEAQQGAAGRPHDAAPRRRRGGHRHAPPAGAGGPHRRQARTQVQRGGPAAVRAPAADSRECFTRTPSRSLPAARPVDEPPGQILHSRMALDICTSLARRRSGLHSRAAHRAVLSRHSKHQLSC